LRPHATADGDAGRRAGRSNEHETDSSQTKELALSTNDTSRERGNAFGYREAMAEVNAALTESEQRRLAVERAARRAWWQRRSVVLDKRGLALAAE
jgi:hypothetical protein